MYMTRNIWIGIVVVILLGAGFLFFELNRPSMQIPERGLPVPVSQSGDTTSQNPQANITQLTKEQVLNGYDQCGNQFINGDFTFPGDFNMYSKWDVARANEGKPTCPIYQGLFSDDVRFADLDGDGILEAILPARVASASSGGALYVFKNVNGKAHVADVAIIGKENINIVSVSGNTIVGKTDGAMGYPQTTKTYKFVNGKLIEQ